MNMFGFTLGEAFEIEMFADENNLTLDQTVDILNIKGWKL